ncbi:MAG: DNA polymerase III subunit alpha [Verrucomicrobiota bacterium]
MADDAPNSESEEPTLDAQFVHLHLHTEYSTLDGAIRIKDLMARAKEFGMPAVAMTDHGNLYGAIDFYQAAKKNGIKPIIGCEIYLTPPGIPMTQKSKKVGQRRNSHLTVLAKNAKGFENLSKLVSMGHLEGFYYKPRVDKETLAQYAEGLIVLSGCITGEINQFIQDDMIDEARESVESFIDIFGKDHFFLEIHDHGMEAQHKCTAQLVKFAEEYDLKLVAANDCHFLNRADHKAHDILICIGTNRLEMDQNRMTYSEEVYFKSEEEMREVFKDYPEAVSNSRMIADMCDLEIELDATSIEKYPRFAAPDGSPPEEFFRRICQEGLVNRYGDEINDDLQERLDYEIGIMEKMGFISYFLIVWDFIKWAKDNGIPVGPGRGSAAGSLVAYALEITDICPIRFGLIFERFLNPERVSPPDVDVDFCPTRRMEVIDYVRRKYGERCVSHIITFGTLGAKSVVRDVGRVMGWSFTDSDRLAKMIPNELNINLADARQKNPELKEALENEAATKQVWDYATSLEGLTRGTGVHAAGVVIGDRDLTELMALTRAKEGEIVSQYAMSPLTDLGMLKMDFLGLKNLTVIKDAVDLIHVHTPDFDIATIPLDDQATFDLLNRGETCGVFQLESGGMVNLCKQFDVNSIDDIIALIALYRPGPMDFIPSYIARKKGKEQVDYPHPLFEEIAKETYGILIYQEQVQRCANVLAGYSLGQADLLRRAMGKKKVEIMEQERVKFVKGAKEVNDIEAKLANQIFDILQEFAKYGFNKSHSAAYGLVSYQTAYLKANYPVEFMSGLLSNEINNTEKIAVFVAECQKMGIDILPPSVNLSRLKFSPEKGIDEWGQPKRAIRFGIAAIKNVGEGAMAMAVEEREKSGEFKSLEDFSNRLDSKTVNKKILESLIRCGAFDFSEEKRAAMFNRLDQVVASAATTQKDLRSGQGSLFGMDEIAETSVPSSQSVVEVEEWPQDEMLVAEKDLLGFYVTGHPLDLYRKSFKVGKYKKFSQIPALPESKSPVRFAGLITEAAVKYAKKDGKPFAILMVEDFSGTTEIPVWNDVYNVCSQDLLKGNVVVIKGNIEFDRRNEVRRLNAQEISPLEAIPFDPAEFEKETVQVPIEPIELVIDSNTDQVEDLKRIKAIAERHRGHSPLRLRVHTNDGSETVILVHRRFWIEATDDAKKDLGPWLIN